MNMGVRAKIMNLFAEPTLNSRRERSDRRSTERFPIEREVRYRIMSKRSAE